MFPAQRLFLNGQISLPFPRSRLEPMNARIQKIKAMACGFRNRARFRTAILFHTGGLSLMPTIG